MDTYLSQTRKSVDCLSDYETIHAVLANESADLDSVISSLVQAFYLYQITSSPKTLIVPVLNIPRSDYHLKTEAVHVLKQHGITAELLTFRDDLDLLELHNLKKLKLTLVDQNVLPNKDLPLEECVIRVIDHRPRERPESSFCNVTVEPVGSCCTLIADEIFKGSYSNQIDDTVANLLFSTILVDTMNMSKDAGHGTAKDEEMLQRLEVMIPNSCREKTFNEIQDVKYDLSNLTTLEILQKDLKMISGNGTNIAMSSIAMKIQDFIKREDLESSLNKFAELQATKAVVIMGVFVINGKILRDLGVFSLSKNFQDKIIETLTTTNTPYLALEIIPYGSENLVVFSQGNNQATRKLVLPILKSLLTSEDFSRLLKDPEKEIEYSHHGNSACGGICGDGNNSSSGGGVIGSGGGFLEQELKRVSKYSDSASSLSGTSLNGTDTSTDQFDTFSPTTCHNDSDHPSTMLDNGMFVSSAQTKPNPADHNNSHIINSENEDHTLHTKYNSNIDNVDFLNKHHQVDNFVCIQTEHPVDIAAGDKCPSVREVISPGIASPMEIVSDQTSDQGSSYPVTPPNSFMDSNFSIYMKDYHLPSFNSAEMVQRIKEKKATLDIHDDPENNGTSSKNHSLHFPYTPQNSSIESEFESDIHKTLSPDIIDDILEKLNEANPHSRAAINPNYAKRSNGENLGFLSCSDFDTSLVDSSSSENVTDVAYSLANEIIQNSLESYPYVNKLVEPLKEYEKRLAPLVKSRSEGNAINLAIQNECPKSRSDVANLSNVLETEYARQFDPFNGGLEYTHFSLDFADYMAKRGVSESASKISSGSYSDDITVSSDSTKSDDGLIVRKETNQEIIKTQDHSKLLDPNSLPDEPPQVSPNSLMPPDSILSSIEDNLSDLTIVSPTKSNLAPDASTSDVESESTNEEDNDSDPERGDEDFAAELREKLSQIGTNDSLLHGPENDGMFSPEELRSGIQRMSFTNNLATAAASTDPLPLDQIANFSAEALRQKLEKIALDENGAVGGLREFTYDSDSDSEISPSTTEGNVHTIESANPSPRPLSSVLMEVIEENEEEEEEEEEERKEDKEQQAAKIEEKQPQCQINVTLQNSVTTAKPAQSTPLLVRHNVPLNESPLVTETPNKQTSQSSFDTYLEPVVLRRQGNKEVFHTTAGRISISIDNTAGDGVSPFLPDRDSSEDIGIMDYKQTHREVGEILARAKSAILRADAELMLSSSSLCAGVDACLQSDNKVQTEGLRRGHKDGSSSKLQQCVDHPLAQTTDDMKRITLSGEVLHDEEEPVASDPSSAGIRNAAPAEKKADRSSLSSSFEKMSNHQVEQKNANTNENHNEIPPSKEEENRAVRPSTLQPIRPKKKIKPNVGDFFNDEDLDGEGGSPPGENMLGNIDDLQTPEDLDTPEEVDVDDLGEIDWESETPLESPSAIPEYTAEEERADSKHWKAVWIGDKQYRIDMKVVEPYKKVLSHGGYMGEDLNAIIVFSGCFLPDRGRKDYNYVMDNLFLYVTSTLEQLVAEDYMIVFFHGATPRRQMPGFSWLKRCYQMIDHRLKKNLKALLLVHPTLWLKTIVMMTRPFISSKFYSKLRYVKTLEELTKVVPMEHVYVPEQVKLCLSLRVHTDSSRVRHQAPEEGRRVKRPKRCDNNNHRDEDTSPNIQSNNKHRVDHLMRINPKAINEERSKRNSFPPATPASLSTSH